MKKISSFATGLLVISIVCFIVGTFMLKSGESYKSIPNAVGLIAMSFLLSSVYLKEYQAPNIIRKLFIYISIVGFVFAIAGIFFVFVSSILAGTS